MEIVEASNKQHEQLQASPASSPKAPDELRFAPLPQSELRETAQSQPWKFRHYAHALIRVTNRGTCFCSLCILSKIWHLCHDEPREPEKATKKPKRQHSKLAAEANGSPSGETQAREDNGLRGSPKNPQASAQVSRGVSRGLDSRPASLIPRIRTSASNVGKRSFVISPDDLPGSLFQDMHDYHPSWAFNDSEVTTEYNLMNDFLNNSLLDDGAVLTDDASTLVITEPAASMLPRIANSPDLRSTAAPRPPSSLQANAVTRPGSVLQVDKAREYYLQAADPTGNDAPEARMQKLLRAKYEAGMLKPFNYVNGYKRLSEYMDSHIHTASKQKILRQLDEFRPKFREKARTLTDMELVIVEMWFEQSLMEYDRVFASMAIPACCWRRTGEIYRGNKEMAELLHVPIEKLRDGKIALHEVLTEESLVNYWEKFGAIAFENQKALLTSCSLKNPDETSKNPVIKCCFSFTIKRNDHKIPSLIIGNFLPQEPQKK